MQIIARNTLFLILAILALSSCRSAKQLSAHRSSITNLAYSNLSPEQKFDGLAETLAAVLDESLTFRSPLRTYRYLDKFTRQNDDELTIIIKELDAWQLEMSVAQKLKLATQLAGKPYMRRLALIIPKVSKMMEENNYKLGKLESALLLFRLRQVMKK